MNVLSPVIVAGIFLSFAGAAYAASHTERDAAEDALNSLGPVTDQITNGNMQNTVVPFGGTNIDEANLEPSEFDREILDIRAGSGQDGRAHQSTVDSFNNRPQIDLGSDPLALADDSVENAEAGLGGLFSANSGTCDAFFQDGSYDGLKLCNAILKRDIRVCEVWRDISVDREDFWACEMAERDFTRTCTRNVSWTCTGMTGAACRADRLRANRSFTWEHSNRQMRFHFAGDDTFQVCFVRSQRIVLKSYVGFDITQLDVSRFAFSGIGQIQVNGDVVWTTGTDSRGPLNIKYLDAGGKDGSSGLSAVVHAGATPIDFCPPAGAPTVSAPRLSLLSSVQIPRPGPSQINANNRPFIPMGEKEDIVIDLLVANMTMKPDIEFRLNVDGACCSHISATGGETC